MALIFNNGVTKITPASSSALTVVIDGDTYTTAWDTNVATTIDNFVSANAAAIANTKGIAVIDSTTTIDFYNTDGHDFTASTGTAAAAYEKLVVNAHAVVTQTAATTLVLGTEVTNTSYDVVTLTFPTEKKLNDALPKLVRNVVGGDVVDNFVCKAAVA